MERLLLFEDVTLEIHCKYVNPNPTDNRSGKRICGTKTGFIVSEHVA